MHLEVCVEDALGKIFLDGLLSRILRHDVSWNVHGYKGIGRLPRNLGNTNHPARRIFLDNLPKLIRGCANTPYVNSLIVVVDCDDRDCETFLNELKAVHAVVAPNANVVFRIAIEEMEAWFLGDPDALRAAFPFVREDALAGYSQDSVCGTWEKLADVIHPGKSAALLEEGWPAPGEAKCRWAAAIFPHMALDESNYSHSFRKLLQAFAPYT